MIRIIVSFVIIAFLNCTTSKNQTISEVSNSLVLTVTKIQPEKDGYTTFLKDNKGGKYTMIVSIPNLGKDYIDLKEGEQVMVEGAYAESYPVQIFAKKIIRISN
ncbi:hypothetical protein UJ101_01626 [Flavobacteriaceae bacterium UJ101]|nr:hypothetical protein UJ101_01626 [Flavobacteriaceae bacterium UJ101]